MREFHTYINLDQGRMKFLSYIKKIYMRWIQVTLGVTLIKLHLRFLNNLTVKKKSLNTFTFHLIPN